MSSKVSNPSSGNTPYPANRMLNPAEKTLADSLALRLENLLLDSARDAETAKALKGDIDSLVTQIDEIATVAWKREMRIPLGSIVGIEQDGGIYGISLDAVALDVVPSYPYQWCLLGRQLLSDGSVSRKRGLCIELDGATLKHRTTDGTWQDVPAWYAPGDLPKCGTAAGPVVIRHIDVGGAP